MTPHLRSLGAIEIPREVYLGLLRELRDDEVQLLRDRLPVKRLPEPGALDAVTRRRRYPGRRLEPPRASRQAAKRSAARSRAAASASTQFRSRWPGSRRASASASSGSIGLR